MPLFRQLDTELFPGHLYLHSMPGRLEDIDAAFNEMEARNIHRIVCLAEMFEVRKYSPLYYEAIQNGTVPVDQLVVVQVRDFHAPDTSSERELFVQTVDDALEALNSGMNILVHCAAGIGRTGTFVTALLLRHGMDLDEAIERVEETGSYPGSSHQLEFLRVLDRRSGS
jgi:protein-tyrosine phosphatase